MWARRHLDLFLFLLWMLVILCYFVNTDSLSLSEKLPRHNGTLKVRSNWEILLKFFFPTNFHPLKQNGYERTQQSQNKNNK
ncbi:hypothetical protein ACRRTK_001708 [Alexandromys fortis]